MENYLEYIDAYFQRMLDPEEIKRFEQKITEDKEFADEVAFYLSAKQSLKAEADREKKEWFRELLAQQRPVIDIDRNRLVGKDLVVQSVCCGSGDHLCIFGLVYFLFKTCFASANGRNYIDDNLKTLPVTMGEKDSLRQDCACIMKADMIPH